MLALEALERAIVQTSDIEDELLKFLGRDCKVPATAIFEPEELEDAERREFGHLSITRRQAVVGLGEAVAALRREAERGDH